MLAFMPTNARRKSVLTTAVAAVPIPLIAPRHTRLYRKNNVLAALVPGNGVIESTTIGGTATFFNIYQNVIVARILLSWFPGLQNSQYLRPLYTVCDPYLNLFRSVVPPIFGLDLSPILALFLLQALGSATIALGAEIPDANQQFHGNKCRANMQQRSRHPFWARK